uniref:Partner and localiser of BRCA2 WD40 domain-containing protein n=1 Tax=Monopterus albus TaxID=43700 RepID=A0A3Q3KE28_MONAL|nr:partner and localizer of BRCA2 [Monopterus albus]
MTASQSQPDLQAIINSQLSMKQRRRSRGHSRGRGLNRNTHSSDCSAQHTQTYSSSQNPASVDPHKLSHMQAAGASSEPSGNNQSSSEISEHACPSQTNTDAFSSPTVCATRPGRGRRRKRGRGRGRPQIPRSSLNLDLGHTSDCSQATSTLVSSSPSLRVAHGSKPSLVSQEDVPVTHKPEPAPVYITATQPSSGINGAQDNSGSGHLEKVCPIFVKSSTETKRSSQRSIGTASWQSLLLPSSPAQTSLCPLRFQPPGLLVSNLRNLDIHQDFYLPDDQFALLKLLKLRQITVELGVEQFTSPSYNTRSSTRRSNICWTSSNDALIPFPLLLSLTPTDFTVEKPSTTQSAGVQNLFIDDKHASQSLVEGTSDQDTTETPGGQQTENLQAKTLTSSAESVSLVEDCAADCVSQYKEHETVTLNSHNESGLSASSTHTSVDHPVKACLNFVDRPAGKVNDSVTGQSDYLKIKQPALEKQPDCADVVHPLENLREHNTVIIDCPLEQTPDEPSNSYNVKSPAKDSKGPCKPTHSPPIDKSAENKTQEKCVLHHIVPSQLLLSPPVASAPCPFLTPHLLSSALPSSPTLPSLGVTPVTPATSSSTSPRCTLPPAHSPSTQALSPQALSPCPSFMPLPTSQPPDSPSSQNQASLQPPDITDQCYRVQMATCPTVSSIQAQGSGRLLGPRTEETTKKHMLRCIHTLKAPAGDCLVDACCLAGHSGGLYVAAAGKWAVCLWSQVSANDWSLIHSWSFNKPVINVFPVPDAAGLLCVTLGQLEISEVRMLSCSSFLQVLLYEGGVQAVVSVSKSRVVTSSHSAIGSTMKVFYLSDSNSMPGSQPLVSPGVCIGALAPVEELFDALIGTDECGHLFIWNLKTGQLLQKIILGDDLSHTACLRGYSYCGVLFVLLQHQFLSSLEEEETEAKAKDEMFSDEGKEEERKKTALFSLVTVNPLSGKSVLATQLSPPKAWSGSRLYEADVNSSSVVGLSQSGCMCVWELGRQGASEMVRAPESEGWQLARWGVRDVLLTGHHNGDVSLHCYSTCQASLCN